MVEPVDGQIVGIFSYPWPKDYEFGKTPLRQGGPFELYRKAVWLKANPRREDYMKTLFLEHWPTGAFINADKTPDWVEKVSMADTVILLYSDSIGLGFYEIEARVSKSKRKWAAVRVLNGRKRKFLLSKSIQHSLRLRRVLERFVLAEILATFLFIAVTPMLVVFDWARGRR